MNKLIVLLGTGQTKLKDTSDRSYRKTKYIRQDTQQVIETPFFAEALVTLYPKRFDTVEIFGTQDSMWETLFVHCLNGENTEKDEDVFNHLTSEIKNLSEDVLQHVADTFVKKCSPNIQKARCNVIPVGRSEDEIWKIFRNVTERCDEKDTISVDITHGLRYQSAFLLLTVVMLRAVKNVKVDSVFYGALELKDDEKAPVIDLRPLVEILDWTIATNDFQDYSNVQKLNALLNNQSFESLTNSLNTFATALQLNSLDKVVSEAKRLQSICKQDDIKKRFPEPAQLLLPEILRLPSMLAQNDQSWRHYMRIARWQYEHEQIGLSVLSTWEAVINRIAILLDVKNYENNYKAYIELSKIARGKEEYANCLTPLGEFSKKADILNEYRKAIAHADVMRFRFEDFRSNFREILGYFEQYLGRKEIEKINCQEVKKTFQENLEKATTKS